MNNNLYFIVFIYFLTVFSFFIFKNNLYRSLSLILISLLSIYLFNTKLIYIILFCIIGTISALTEAFFINFYENTWIYNNPDIFKIPSWLFILWFLVITVSIQSYKIINEQFE